MVGPPPLKSPSLSDYPQCDAEVQLIVSQFWSKSPKEGLRHVGEGGVIYLPVPSSTGSTPEIYPDYEQTAALLSTLGVSRTSSPMVPSGTRTATSAAANATSTAATAATLKSIFSPTPRRSRWPRYAGSGSPSSAQLWDPLTGLRRPLPQYRQEGGVTIVPLQFAADQSYFVVFRESSAKGPSPAGSNFPSLKPVLEIAGPWEVSFDPKWGGPAQATFQKLDDWSKRPEEGIKHYSGKATYGKTFAFPSAAMSGTISLSLGDVKNMAAVRLNGTDLGVVWCEPWRVELPPGLLKPTGNRLEITVANLWPNRLIGDAALPPAERRTWTTWSPCRKDSPLSPSGLLGPVGCCGPTNPASSRCKTSSSASRRRQSPSRRPRRSPRA